MSEKYKFHNPQGIYFVSFATVYWIDVFVRYRYFNVLLNSLKYCQYEKGLVLYCYCFMPSHVHLIFSACGANHGEILKSFKTYTSKKLREEIEKNSQESRREWILSMMSKAANRKSNVKKQQFWQHSNHPIELWSNRAIDQKVAYIHENPVEAGFVEQAEHWKYSSAVNYSGRKGIIDVEFLD